MNNCKLMSIVNNDNLSICKNFIISFNYFFIINRIGIIIAKEGEEENALAPIESDGNEIKFIKLIPSLLLALPECERKSLLLGAIDNVAFSGK